MPSGSRLSLRMSFTRSAIGWSRPNGPTRLGPRRTWNRPSRRSSSHVRNANTSMTRFASTNALMNVTMNPSGTRGLRRGDHHGARADVRPPGRDPDDTGAQAPQHDRSPLVLAAVVGHAYTVARLHAQPLGVVVRDLDAGAPLEVQRGAVVDGCAGHELAVADDDGARGRLGGRGVRGRGRSPGCRPLAER